MFGWQEVVFGFVLLLQLALFVAALENKKIKKAVVHFCFVHGWFGLVAEKGVWFKVEKIVGLKGF